jgi:hypothetical protein
MISYALSKCQASRRSVGRIDIGTALRILVDAAGMLRLHHRLPRS